MRRLIISLLLIAVSGISLKAYDHVLNNPDSKPYVGYTVGVEMICPGKIKADGIGIGLFSKGMGVDLGMVCNIPLVANLYVEPALKWYMSSYDVKKAYLSDFEPGVVYKSIWIRQSGLRIPVMAGYHFDFSPTTRLQVFTGPELEIGLRGTLSLREPDSDEEHYRLYGKEGDMRRTDILWTVGAGVGFGRWLIALSGSFGLLDKIRDSDLVFHENRVTLTFGYNFSY